MTTQERPASPVQGLYYPTPVTPEEAFQAIGRLRKEARDEINRLIRFLDKTDDYVSRELEINGDEADQSYREGFMGGCASPMEDDEDDDPAEDSDGAGDEDSGIGDMDGLMEQVGGHYMSGEVQ